MTNENKPTIELGKQYQTRDGREVRIYAVDGEAFFPIHGAVKSMGVWYVSNWSAAGSHQHNAGYNLIEIKPKRKIEFWVNVYPDGRFSALSHRTRESADADANSYRIACIHFTREYEEGEGL